MRLLSLLVLLGLLSGCLSPQTTSRTARTSVEQLLLTQAVSKSLGAEPQPDFPLPAGSTIKVDLTGLTDDRVFIGAAVEGWLGKNGYQIRQTQENARYRVHVLINAFGTEQGDSFLGMPAIQSVLIPFSLPEIVLYRAQRQAGRVQFYLNIYDTQTGKLVKTSDRYEGETFHNRYTALLFLSFLSTNLVYTSE